MLEPNKNQNSPATIVHNGAENAPAIAKVLHLEFNSSAPRNVKAELTTLFKNEIVVRYLFSAYGENLHKVVVVGKKRGEPDLRYSGNVATVTVSPDGGAVRRFVHQLLDKARSTLESNETETEQSKLKAGKGIAELSTAKCFTDRLFTLVQQWACKEFLVAPPAALAALLKTEEAPDATQAIVEGQRALTGRTPLSIELDAELPRISRISCTDAHESIQSLAQFVRQPDLSKELKSRHKHLCRAVAQVSSDFFNGEELLEGNVLRQHAESIGTLAVVSFLRYLADERMTSLKHFAEAVNQVGQLIEDRFVHRIEVAIEKSERQPVENFVNTTTELINCWTRSGLFGILGFLDRELMGGQGTGNQLYCGLVAYRDRVRQFLITHDELSAVDVSVETDTASMILNVLRPCLPVINTPQSADLTPFKEPLVAFGKQLVAFAQSASDEHRAWYVNAFSGILEQTTDETAEQSGDKPIDESPEYVLGMLKDLVVWGNDPHDPRIAPGIVGPDRLLEAVIARAAFEAGLASFEKMKSEADLLSINQFEKQSQVVQELMGIVYQVRYQPSFSLCATTLTHCAKYKFEIAQAEYYRHLGDHTRRQTLLMNAVTTALSCAEKASQFPLEYQREYIAHLRSFFHDVVATAHQIEKEGEIGLALTSLEPGLQLLDQLGDKGELRAQITTFVEGCINTLVDTCQQITADREYWANNPEAAQFALDGIAEQLAKWQPTSRLAASKDYVVKHHGRALGVLKKR